MTHRRKKPSKARAAEIKQAKARVASIPIHQRIAELRKSLGLKQSDLAKLCKVDVTAISHWERGFSAPTGSRLPLVADALGVSIGELYSEAA